MQRKLIALALLLCLLPLAACGSEAEKQPFADTLCIDYITPEDEVYAREPELEAAVASMLRSAIPDAPDISVNLRRRERFGPVEGEPAPDGEIVLAPKMNAQGTLDFDALAFDIACSIAGGMGLGEEVIAALGGGVEVTVDTTTTTKASDIVTTAGATQAAANQTTAPKTNPPVVETRPPVDNSGGEYPKTVDMTDVMYIVPQGVGNFKKTFEYDRFTDAPSFAITNNQGKEMVVRLRPADPNNPKKSYADLYTDKNGDGTGEWQRTMECYVSSDSSLGEYEGRTNILIDSNYFGNFGGDSGPHSIETVMIYWIKEHGAAQIIGGQTKTIPYSEYRRLQNAGSGVNVVQCTDGTYAAYYK